MSGFGGFGGGNAFGSNSNNATSTGFGGFGSNTNSNTGTGFGSNTNTGGFGSNANTGGGLFGSGNTTNTGFGSSTGGGFGSTNNAFGAPKPAFGASTTTSGGGGLFGSSTPATSGGGFGGFGSTANNNTSTTSGFGGGSSLFGSNANKPAFGAGTTTGTSNLFGGGGSTGNSGFGSGTASTGAFGAPASTALGAPVGDPPGTAATPFQPFIEKEANSSAQNSFQNILFQEPYKKWSADELRLVDYVQGRKFGNGTGTGAFGVSTGFGGGFGSNTQTTGNSFGSANTTSATAGGLFGNTNNASGGFGQNSNTSAGGFGASGGGLFGANKPATGGLFGSTPAAQPAQTGGGLFGNSTAQSTTGGFGSAFGANNNTSANTGGGLFGNQNNQNKPAGGFSFGGNNSTTTGGFGSANTNNAFSSTANTGGGGLFGNSANNNTAGQTGGGLFGNNAQQQNPSGGFGAFGQQSQQPQAGSSLFGNNSQQQKPAGGLFGTATATNTGGGLFGNTNNNASSFGASNNNQASGGLFSNKPATTNTGGLFANNPTAQSNAGGGGLFGGLGQNNQSQQQQSTTGGGLFGGLNQNNPQQKSSLFGGSTQSTGGGLFGGQNNQQQGSLFGSTNNQAQQQNAGLGGSMFGNSTASQQSQQTLTASINDPSAFGNSPLFGNLGAGEITNPGPLATPLSGKKPSKRSSILPIYKLNPTSSRFVTPQKRGFGFSYSTYGSPASPSSVASTPGGLSHGLLNGSLRGLSKSVSTSSLRRSFNVEDSLLAPGAFSASSGPRYYGGSSSVKKLVINRDLRSDLFSTPTKEKPAQEAPNGSRKLSKRVSFDTSNVEAIENGDANEPQRSVEPSAEALGYIRNTNGINGSKSSSAPAAPEMEQVKGNELAIVHEEEFASPATTAASPSVIGEGEVGEYWMKPSFEEIQNMNRVQRQKVIDFTIGRDGSGSVRFKVPVDLSNIDIETVCGTIVLLETRSCTVYPDSAVKPPMGKGLNVPAEIKLENSWPRGRDKKSGSKVRSGSTLTKHIERLKRIPDTTFEGYDKDTGVWTFSVEHFTTYGLDEDEDDESEGEQSVDLSASEPTAIDDESPRSPANPGLDIDTFDFRKQHRSIPGAFGAPPDYEVDDHGQMSEDEDTQQSFLASRSAGSPSRALVLSAQDAMDEEYEMSEQGDASASSGHHHAAGPEDNSFGPESVGPEQGTAGGILRARMRAIKESATPLKVQVAAGDDWMDMLQKTISPQKRDRAFLKNLRDDHGYQELKQSTRDKSLGKKRIVSDGRGFATSIDLMNSLFEKGKGLDENLQAPVGPSALKWPYKRVTKNLDESDMEPKERAYHDSLRPSWGPDGTLVFAAPSSNIQFGRTSRITEKNGLVSVMKGAIVSERQDIRFAKFSNESSAKAIRNYIKMSKFDVIDGTPTVQIDGHHSLKSFSQDQPTTNANPAGQHEQLVWDLAAVLFDRGKDDRSRREDLSRFWEKMVGASTNQCVAMARSHEEKAIASLSGHRIADACKHLIEGKNFHLATLISLIGTSDQVKRDMKNQIKDWQDAKALSEFTDAFRALYELLAGNTCVSEGSKGAPEDRTETFVVSKKFGLDWKQAFGLRLWYSISADDGIAKAVKIFADDVGQDKERRPAPWFMEHGIQPLWVDHERETREDLLWGLLCLYSDRRVDLESVLRPENSQLSPLDYRLCWQLGQALVATGNVSFGENSAEKADAASVSFASQLTNEGSWIEAIFVLLHLSNPTARIKSIRDHLCRHAGLLGSEQTDTFKTLTQTYKLPADWIWEAKALHMRSVKKDYAAEVQCLLCAGSFAAAHHTFVKEVAPVAIIERNYAVLEGLLHQFDGSHDQIPDWNVGGAIYKTFLQLAHHQQQHRGAMAPANVVAYLLDGLPAMHGNTPEASVWEYAALTDMATVVADIVAEMARNGQMNHEKVLSLPLTEDVLLKHSRDLAWSHYTTVMAGE